MEHRDEDPLQELLDFSWEQLQNAQKHIEEAFEGYELTDYDLKEGYMELAKNEHQRMRVPIYPVGSFSQNDSAWWWAWANSSFSRHQRKKIQTIQGIV